MNLKISYNWLKEYLKTDKSVNEFAKEFSLKSQTIDRIEPVKPKFKEVITAKILEIEKHPGADKLKLVKLDAGKTKPTVVCGAPNIKAGQVVPLALVGAKVLDPTEEGKTFTIKKAKIRDVESNGMLCSQKELGLGQDHTGIMILPDKTPIGKPLEEILDLNDYLLEIEVTSNRPDAMSVVGLAREAASAVGGKFTFETSQPNLKVSQAKPLLVEVLEPKLCPRYQAVVMTDVEVGPSPLWLQIRLLSAGLRPINNLVDITNYILLEYGRPMHVFDYEKLAGQKIIVRKAKAGEKILALDGKTYSLKPDHLVIADSKVPVAIGGVMGGEDSAATFKTKTIVFEAAAFDPVLIRKTARELNLHSESSDLFEKNLHSQTTLDGILRAIELTQKLAKGIVASNIIDISAKKYQPTKVSFDPASVKRHLGVEIPLEQIKKILESLGFGVAGSKILNVTIPYWRANDVAFEYDLIEEIARIYGYHNLPTQLPQGEIPFEPKNPLFFWETVVKKTLAALGFTESYNYSMVSKELLQQAKFPAQDALKIYNPLNEEMEYLRPTLLPQVLKNVADNFNNFSEQKIFELSHIYLVGKDNQLPTELPKLTGAVLGQNSFLVAKGVVEILLKEIGIFGYQMVLTDPECPLWEKDHTLDIRLGKQFLGQFGIVRKNILEHFDLKKPVALFDFDFKTLAELATTVKTYRPIPEFPSVTRDLAILVDEKLSWQAISQLVSKADPLITEVEYLSTFADSALGKGKKSLALRLVFRSRQRTLKSEEVDQVVDKVINKLEKSFDAKLR
ncbi:MAG: phenylalanine--tRNA ligase subunit beta [Patescibacteria group bacterium]|jgi:phenylalanyl-tRNA synthetase beta chain